MSYNQLNMGKRIFFVVLVFSSVAFGQHKKSPNIVFILADDLGYGDLGVYGQQKIETPHIDALARKGMLFTQYYAFPVCAPSRYLLLTGKHSGRAYIRGNDEWEERGDVWDYKAMEANPFLEGQRPIPDSTVTIAKLLQEKGYATGLVGKWGLGAPFSSGTPNRQGFDYFFGFICQREDHTYYPGHLWENTERIPLNNKIISPHTRLAAGVDSLDEENYKQYVQKDYAPDFLIAAGVRFIERNKQHPFFLYYASPLPHLSLQAPKRWVDYYRAKFGEETPFLGGGYFPCRYPKATYAAMVSTLDEEVGKLVKALKEADVYDNTLIVFSSDNGPTFHTGGADSPWFGSGGPFKSEDGWGKGSVQEGGVRVPYIVQWPQHVKDGSHSNLVVAEWDFLPTICKLLEMPVPSQTDGISFLPTLTGQVSPQQIHDYLYWEYPESGGQQAVRWGKWKGIRKNILKGNLSISLYDLEKDLQESHDVAKEYPDIVRSIHAIMVKEHQTPDVSTFEMPALERK